MTHKNTGRHTNTSRLWLSVVSRSADTWKDTLERGPFHGNSAQRHLARTRCFTSTVVKGTRVLISMAAHSPLPNEWRKKSLSWTQHSTGCTLTHTPKQSLTRRLPRVRDLKFEWKNKRELAMSVKYLWVCTRRAETQLPQQSKRIKKNPQQPSVHRYKGVRSKRGK